MRRAGSLVLACLVVFSASAFADNRSVRLGQMELAYDGTRWRTEHSVLSDVTLQPIGDIARALDPVRIRVVMAEGRADCEGHARHALTSALYGDAHDTALTIAGVDAVRLEAGARCRNAMPRAVAVCAAHNGTGYLFLVRQTSCQDSGNNLFSGIDPLREVLEGVRFLP